MRKSFFIFSVFVILCSVFVYADDSNTASNNAVVAQTPVSTGAATSAANTISDKIAAASTNAVSAAVKGFRYAKWICYDGKSSSEGGDSSCKSSETWQKYAMEFCEGHCYEDKSKCGVNTFAVSTECYEAAATSASGGGASVPMPTTAAAPAPTAIPSVATTTTVATSDGCMDESLSKELNELLNRLNEAEQKNNIDEITQIKNKIEYVNQKLKENKEKCYIQKPVSTATQVVISAPTATASARRIMSACANYEAIKQKKQYYEKIINNPEKITSAGMTVEDVKKSIEQLVSMMEDEKKKCDENSKTNLGTMVSEAVKTKEGSAKDIVSYYKTRMSDVVSAPQDTSKQIEQLKGLRTEIDRMISDLISKQENINAADVGQLVKEIKINSKEVTADNVKVEGTNKIIDVVVDDRAAEIKSTKTGVSLGSEGMVANAAELSVENNKVKIGKSELKILPKQITEKMKIQPKEMNIIEQDNKPVYQIKTDEDRKMLGMFNIKMEKHMNVDGASGDLISESNPWWSFMTTAAPAAEAAAK